MELTIHGTKDGYRILHSTNIEFTRIIAKDIRKGAQGDEQLGKTAYSLAFAAKGCVYSKYVIVKDSLRSFATGTIAFSLFMSVNETMKTENILKLLNELYSFYESKYIKNHYLNRGETELIREEWNFVDEILNKYKTEPNNTRHEDINSGTQDAAFIYYQTDNELLDYFDKPFQVEYADFSQVLLIQSCLQGKTDPLKVLKNSGVEIKNIDLKNKYYYLSNFNRGKGISITANGKPRSEGKNNNSIRAKDIVEIYYSKDDQCFEPITEKGTLFDPKIQKYLEVRNNDIIIDYGAFENPDPIKRTIYIEVKHPKESLLNNLEVLCKKENSYDKKIITENKVEFLGSELKERWALSARIGETLFSETKIFVPAQQNERVILNLEEHKRVAINITNPELNNHEIRVTIWGLKNPPKSDSILFVGEEIERTHKINFSASGYNDKIYDYNPQNNQSIQVTLQKQKKYELDTGELGETTSDCPAYSNNPDGSDIGSRYIKPKKGYVFNGWKLKDDQNTLVAQYSEKNGFSYRPRNIASISTLILVFGFSAWFFFFKDSPIRDVKNNAITNDEIIMYLEGDKLLLNKLNDYKTQWREQKPEILEKSTGIRGMFGFDKKETDSIANKEWEETNNAIVRAIFKREKIDSKEFKLVLDSLRFSNNQLNFKRALIKMDSLKKVDSLKYKNVSNNLGDISTLKLSAITDSINAIFNPPRVDELNEISVENTGLPKNIAEQKDEQKQKAIEEIKKNNAQTGQSQGTTNKNSEIVKHLKGKELNKETLENYKNETTNQNLKKSIDLAMKLWDLDGKENNSYSFYQRQLQSDDNFKDSELLKFVNEMCDLQKTPDPKYWNNLRGNKNIPKTLANLKEQL